MNPARNGEQMQIRFLRRRFLCIRRRFLSIRHPRVAQTFELVEEGSKLLFNENGIAVSKKGPEKHNKIVPRTKWTVFEDNEENVHYARESRFSSETNGKFDDDFNPFLSRFSDDFVPEEIDAIPGLCSRMEWLNAMLESNENQDFVMFNNFARSLSREDNIAVELLTLDRNSCQGLENDSKPKLPNEHHRTQTGLRKHCSPLLWMEWIIPMAVTISIQNLIFLSVTLIIVFCIQCRLNKN